jgi:hypothetical protein
VCFICEFSNYTIISVTFDTKERASYSTIFSTTCNGASMMYTLVSFIFRYTLFQLVMIKNNLFVPCALVSFMELRRLETHMIVDVTYI